MPYRSGELAPRACPINPPVCLIDMPYRSGELASRACPYCHARDPHQQPGPPITKAVASDGCNL